MNGFGFHLTLDGYKAGKKKLDDRKLIERILAELPEKLRMTKIIAPIVLKYDGGKNPLDRGITGMVLLAESHISVHTFPEKGFLTADVYCCKEFDAEKTINYFRENYSLKEIETHFIERGKKFPKN